jgi:hypothetical protein
MTIRRKLVIGLVAAAAALFSCCVLEPLIQSIRDPLQRSEKSIAASLFKQTPIGTSKADVQELVRSRGWGYGGTGGEPPGSIEVQLGSYTESFAFDIAVFAVFDFDENDKLSDIRVSKFWRNAP